MRPRNLLLPPVRYLNLPITAVTSVTYDKIITYAIPMVIFPVPFIKYSGIAVFRS
jgi:hypothetical protein